MIKTIYITESPPEELIIGRKGEYMVEKVEVDIHYFVERYGAGRAEVLFSPPYSREEFPVPSKFDGDVVAFDVTEAITAKDGSAAFRVYYYTDYNGLKLSPLIRCMILDGKKDRGEAPEPFTDWITKATELYQHLKDIGVDPEAIKAQIKAIVPVEIAEYFEKHPIETMTEDDVVNILTDYWTLHKDELKGDKGDKGEDGENGRDGIDGEDGKDYAITEADYEAIANVAKDKVKGFVKTVNNLAPDENGNVKIDITGEQFYEVKISNKKSDKTVAEIVNLTNEGKIAYLFNRGYLHIITGLSPSQIVFTAIVNNVSYMVIIDNPNTFSEMVTTLAIGSDVQTSLQQISQGFSQQLQSMNTSLGNGIAYANNRVGAVEVRTTALENASTETNENLLQLETEVSNKMPYPSEAPSAVGKVLAVKQINEDGSMVVEWADAPSGGVSDVTVGGESVVDENGNAVIPNAETGKRGLVFVQGYGLSLIGGKGQIAIEGPTETEVGQRTAFKSLTPSKLDYAVKHAMSAPIGTQGMKDGIYNYPEWTAEEKERAQIRLGILSSEGVMFGE